MLEEQDPYDIPSFLLLTASQRAAAWERNPPKAPPPMAVAPREVELARAEEKQRKTAARIAKLKAGLEQPKDRRGMRWDTMRSRWVPDVLTPPKSNPRLAPEAPPIVSAKKKPRPNGAQRRKRRT